ncbi:MAG: hypothetical protein IKD06_02875 [Clostridia bacterium]|nr:hypothetical protein [Clostridia bacterium]
MIDVKQMGIAADKTADAAPVLKQLLARLIREDPVETLYFSSGTYLIGEDVHIPLSMDLVLEPGAVLYVAEGVSLRIEAHIDAGLEQIFDGPGLVEGFFNNSRIYPQWYGAKGDGKHDDTAAFRAAVRNGCEIAVPYTADGYVLGGLELTERKYLYGCDEKPSVIVAREDCKDLFTVKAPHVKVEHLRLEMGKTGESACFYFECLPGQPISHAKVRDIETHFAWHAVRDARKNKNEDKVYITNTVVEDLRCYNSRSTAVRVKNFWGFIFFRDLLLDNRGLLATGVANGDYPAFELEDNEGAILQRIRIFGTGKAANENEHGFHYVSNVATWMDDCSAREVGGSGLKTVGENYHLYFSNTCFSDVGGYGMEMHNNFYPQMNELTATNCAAGAFLADNVMEAQLNALTSQNCGTAVRMSQCHHCAVTRLDPGKDIPVQADDLSVKNVIHLKKPELDR